MLSKSILFSILALFTIYNQHLFSQETKQKSSIIVKLDNHKNNKGLIGINIFIEEDGFPSDFKKSFVSETFEINVEKNEYIIKDIPPGIYGVSVMHDENSNLKIDTNIFGVPKEGYAVSNNVKPRKFGPPKFSDALIEHGNENTILELKLIY